MVLVGAGGAGRAVAFALMDLGVAFLVIHDCDAARASALAADLAMYYGASRCCATNDLQRDVLRAQGIVNATQVGMRGFPGNPVPVSMLHSSLWAADVIYTPVETEFIKAAAAKGARVSMALACACTRRSPRSGCSPVSSLMWAACIAYLRPHLPHASESNGR